MAKKDFKLLLALDNRNSLRKVRSELDRTYTVKSAVDIKDLSQKLKAANFNLVIIDHDFSGMLTEDLQQKITHYCPNTIYVVYSEEERRRITKQLHKHRAIDFILYSQRLYDFVEKIHKGVRWTVLQMEVTSLGQKITRVAESIKDLSRKIEKLY